LADVIVNSTSIGKKSGKSEKTGKSERLNIQNINSINGASLESGCNRSQFRPSYLFIAKIHYRKKAPAEPPVLKAIPLLGPVSLPGFAAAHRHNRPYSTIKRVYFPFN